MSPSTHPPRIEHVAVVTTCPGRQRLLERALASIAAQTSVLDAVLVIVDRGPSLLAEVSEITKRAGLVARVVANDRTPGASGARNMVLDALGPGADGSRVLVSFLDDDDVWLPTYAAAVRAASANGGEVVAADIVQWRQRGGYIKQAPRRLLANAFLVHNAGIIASNLSVDLDVLRSVGGYDESLAVSEDRDLAIRLADEGVRYRHLAMPAVLHDVGHGAMRLSDPRNAENRRGLDRFYEKHVGRMSAGIRRRACAKAFADFGWTPPARAASPPARDRMKTDLSREVTAFVTTIGDQPNFTDCMQHLHRQSVRSSIDVIDRVAPMSAAFQEMHDRCATPYYVQVDEDMILAPHALELLVHFMRAAPPEVAMICAPLWDRHVEHPIYGVKIYRHAIVRDFPYRDCMSCEKEQMSRWRAAGFRTILLPMQDRGDCLGEHGKHPTPASIFVRWRRLLQKQRAFGSLGWVEPWPAKLLERFLETREPIDLYAFLGSVAGLTGDLPPDREVDFRAPDADLARLASHFPTEAPAPARLPRRAAGARGSAPRVEALALAARYLMPGPRSSPSKRPHALRPKLGQRGADGSRPT